MAIETRIIQVRRGKESELDKSKFLPGEFGSATDTKKIFHAFAPNVVKELAFKEDIKVTTENIKNALGYTPADQEDITELNEKLVQETGKLSSENAELKGDLVDLYDRFLLDSYERDVTGEGILYEYNVNQNALYKVDLELIGIKRMAVYLFDTNGNYIPIIENIGTSRTIMIRTVSNSSYIRFYNNELDSSSTHSFGVKINGFKDSGYDLNKYEMNSIGLVVDYPLIRNKKYNILVSTKNVVRMGIYLFNDDASYTTITENTTGNGLFEINTNSETAYVRLYINELSGVANIEMFVIYDNLLNNLSDFKAKQTLSILGDSYSTFVDYCNPQGAIYYPTNDSRSEGYGSANDVLDIKQTWWYMFMKHSNLILNQNSSWSGSPICYDGYGDGSTDAKSYSFVTRCKELKGSDYIIVEGGTNDSACGASVGEYKYSNFNESDFVYYRPSLAYVLNYLQSKFPNSKIIFMLNSGLREDITNSTITICEHYNIPILQLVDIPKVEGHPNSIGMYEMSKQLFELLSRLS